MINWIFLLQSIFQRNYTFLHALILCTFLALTRYFNVCIRIKIFFSFIKAAYVRENLRRMQVLNSQMLDTEMGEFLCPLCKRLSNCFFLLNSNLCSYLGVLPVFPSYHCLKDVTGFSTDRPFDSGTFEKWIDALTTALFTQHTPVQAKGHSRKRYTGILKNILKNNICNQITFRTFSG